ncbi:YfaP family protein [Trichloromonas acetexigens]|uniref:Lecithin:cholesterol acyltransferase n=1 Tax=Trichloromonas acetexigens TaxID=38815 RepID=A0A550JHB2_9BACT|nr:hypothetical protein [Desulfuromonas acetexigens]TRO82574.1 hypothetical protein FL622_05120 [Desulfuromonas acetexigens]
MKWTTRLLAVLFLFFIPSVTFGEGCYENKGTYVYFVNGMFTPTAGDAWDTVNLALKPMLDSAKSGSGISSENLIYKVSYNKSETFPFQVLEVARQKIITDWQSIYQWLANLEEAPDWFKDAMLTLSKGMTAGEYVIDSQLRNFVSKYRENLDTGYKVLLFAHSQGNFYSNLAFTWVNKPDNVGIVSVATPANYVSGGGPYTTYDHDLVMDSVRTIFPFTLASNAGNGFFDFFLGLFDDWTGHSIVDTYLAGDNTGPIIINNVIQSIGDLLPPNVIAGDGIITVRLEWGAQPDLDLHVFEPNGAHVYYANQRGPSGYLDLDDVNGYGPEHYFVSCDTLETGVYRVGVNYYYGFAPETARVNIVAGDKNRSYSKTLSYSRGSGGNYSPTPIANIEVYESSNGVKSFSVVGQ